MNRLQKVLLATGATVGGLAAIVEVLTIPIIPEEEYAFIESSDQQICEVVKPRKSLISLLQGMIGEDSEDDEDDEYVDTVALRYTVATKYPDKNRIQNLLSNLEKIPDPLQRIANGYGSILIVNKPVDVARIEHDLGIPEFPEGTNRVELVDEGGVKNIWTYKGGEITQIRYGNVTSTFKYGRLDLGGWYSPENRTAVIPQNTEMGPEFDDKYGGFGDLHEPAHLLAFATGLQSIDGNRTLNDVSDEELLLLVAHRTFFFEQVQNILNGHIASYKIETPTEFFANVFATYYDTPESRDALKKAYPTSYRFIAIWERGLVNDCSELGVPQPKNGIVRFPGNSKFRQDYEKKGYGPSPKVLGMNRR